MSDKMKPGIAVKPVFVAGENALPGKLNALSAQMARAAEKLEKAVGDIHNENYPYSALHSERLSLPWGRSDATDIGLTDAPSRDLDIVNLGRLIGPASNLNPDLLGNVSTIVEAIPTGVHEFTLQYVPDDATACVFSDLTVFATVVASKGLIDAAGKYFVDSYGRVYSGTATAGGTVSYDTTPSLWGQGNAPQGATFNVIPDVNQLENGSGCTIGSLDGNGRYPVSLPTATHMHKSNASSITLDASDQLYGYQLGLPKVLTDNFTSGESIPAGFLYLKNYTTNTIYTEASYYYNNATSILVGEIDLSEEISNGDIFCVVTVGSDLTTAISDLRKKLYHSHSRAFGEPLVSVYDLEGACSIEGDSGPWVASEIPSNFAPQYLHRDGFTSGTDNNLNDENIMRGNLGIGVNGATAGAHRTTNGKSYKLQFVGSVNEPTLYRDTSGALVLNPDQGTALGIVPSSATKGIRVRDGLLVPEHGIHSGLSGSSEQKPVSMAGFRVSKTFGSSGVNQFQVDLTSSIGLTQWDLGSDPRDRLLSLSMMILPDGETSYYPPHDSVWGFTWSIVDPSESVNYWRLTVEKTGSGWAGAPTQNVVATGVVWFERQVSPAAY